MENTRPLDTLNDGALLQQFEELVRRDREGNAALLRHIDAIDRRKLWAKLGHPSLFDLPVVRYRMSESTAGKRIGAARTARRFPVLFEMVARGEVHLSAVHCLKAHLTPENHEEVLARAKHKTVRQLGELVARLAPQPDAPTVVRALPNRAPDPSPLSPRRYKLQVTITQDARDTLEQLQALLAHQLPNGDPAAIVERALDALLAQTLKKKAAITERPRARKSGPKHRHRAIPAAIRREVWKRDQGRCTFVGVNGHRCNETRRLEFAHLKPWGKGGEHSVDNIVLRCCAHNALDAERDYGTSFMASKQQPERGDGRLNVRESVTPYSVPRRSLGRPKRNDKVALRCKKDWPRSLENIIRM